MLHQPSLCREMSSMIDNLTLLSCFIGDMQKTDDEVDFLVKNMTWSIGYLERKKKDIPWMGQASIKVLKGTLVMEVVRVLMITTKANIDNPEVQDIIKALQEDLQEFLKQDLTDSFTAFQEEEPIIAEFSHEWIRVGELADKEYFRLYQGIPLSIVYWADNKTWLSRIAGCSIGFFDNAKEASSQAEQVADIILQPVLLDC